MEETTSTFDLLQPISDRQPYDAAVAFSQKNGRGSKGRTFVSPKGGLYLSVYLEPDVSLLPIVTPLAAVAVRRAIQKEFFTDVSIKWVNDLVLKIGEGYKKVCGILTESFTDEVCRVVVGIGINVYRAKEGYGPFDDVAGYLSDEKTDKERIKSLANSVIAELKAVFSDVSCAMKEYAKNSVLTGKEVSYVGDFSGKYLVSGVDERGRLLLQTKSGVVAVDHGEVVKWQG